jgi:phosphatidylglycerophosphatase A
MIKKLNILLLTMFGLGNSKYAPGSVASFVTCLIYVCFYNFQINIVLLILSAFILTIVSACTIDVYKNSFLQIDAKEIVIDEYIGQSIPLLTIYNLIEDNNFNHFIFYVFISFLFFRLFDIWKPFPINLVDDKMKNGFGVILDDIIAGTYAAVLLLIIFFLVDHV